LLFAHCDTSVGWPWANAYASFGCMFAHCDTPNGCWWANCIASAGCCWAHCEIPAEFELANERAASGFELAHCGNMFGSFSQPATFGECLAVIRNIHLCHSQNAFYELRSLMINKTISTDPQMFTHTLRQLSDSVRHKQRDHNKLLHFSLTWVFLYFGKYCGFVYGGHCGCVYWRSACL
jgi:hypothetical protein